VSPKNRILGIKNSVLGDKQIEPNKDLVIDFRMKAGAEPVAKSGAYAGVMPEQGRARVFDS